VIEPMSKSLLRRTRAEIVVEDARRGDPQAIRIEAEAVAARLTVEVVPTDEHGGRVELQLFTLEGEASSKVAAANLDGATVVDVPTRMEPGTYELLVRRPAATGVPGSELRRRVHLEAGRRDRISVAFPGS
jgi:hypothetical protein